MSDILENASPADGQTGFSSYGLRRQVEKRIPWLLRAAKDTGVKGYLRGVILVGSSTVDVLAEIACILSVVYLPAYLLYVAAHYFGDPNELLLAPSGMYLIILLLYALDISESRNKRTIRTALEYITVFFVLFVLYMTCVHVWPFLDHLINNPPRVSQATQLRVVGFPTWSPS